ncbi:MAG: hypothetical protein HS128_23560 [Ideonella sp.]|nr:hypothetical protein [Ideonella sp.]
MPIATLSIDIEARLARLEEGMDRAARINQKAAQDIEQRWAAAGSALKAAVAPLLAAFSADVLRRFVVENARAVDSLNDISDATGATVENISALQDVAQRTGTDIATVETALIKLNQALAGAKPGSDVERALTAIGLSAKQLKADDPAEALRKVAVALSGFADDGNKARLVQELFGKSLKDVAPLLKDLSQQSSLHASITRQQADEAERFVHALGEFDNAATRARQALVGTLLPGITEFIKQINAAREAHGGFVAALIAQNPTVALPANAVEGLQKYEQALGDLNARLEKQRDLQAQGKGSAFAVLDLENKIAKTKELVRYYQILLGLTDQAGAGRGRVNPNPASVGDIFGDGGGKTKSSRDSSLTAEQIARLQVEADEQAAEDSAEAWKAWEKQQLADHKATTAAWALQWKQVFDEIDAEQERAIEDGKAFLDTKVEEVSEFAKQARRNVQDAVGDTLFAGIEGRFADIDDLWRDLLRKMVAQALAANLNEALFGKGPGGGLIGEFFKGTIFAGLFADGGFIPPGQWGIAGERGPEPVFGGSTGATVVPFGKGGAVIKAGDVVVNVDGRADVAQNQAMIRKAVREGQLETFRALRAQGVI